MCTAKKSELLTLQQQQQQQCMSDHLLLRENDADPRTALTASQTCDRCRNFTNNNNSNNNNNNNNCYCNCKRNNNNNNNNTTNSIKTNKAHSCPTINKSKPVNHGPMSLKFSLLFCAILCGLFATQSADAAPRVKRGQHLIHHHRIHMRAAPTMEASSIKDMEQKLKNAENIIKCAHLGARESKLSLSDLTHKFYKVQYKLTEEELKELNSWKQLKLNHAYDNRTDMVFDLSDFGKIKSELHNIKEALEIMLELFTNITIERKLNKTVSDIDEGPEVEGQINQFYQLSREIISLNLIDVNTIMTELNISDGKQSGNASHQVDWGSIQVKNYFIAKEHKRILSIIVSFYEELLQHIKANDSRPDC